MNPLTDNSAAVAHLFQTALQKAWPEVAAEGFTIEVEKPKNPAHGHFAVNSAMQLARKLGQKPRDIAAALVEALPASDLLDGKPDIAGPGFINVRLSQRAETRVIESIFAAADRFGQCDRGHNQKVMVEFVSANPTGPLHVGHGRAAAIGDTLARLLASQGFDVHREYYYNDGGVQINNLTLSVQARARELAGEAVTFPEDGYHGDYIRELAERYRQQHANDPRADNSEAVRAFAVEALRQEQDQDLKAFGVHFDHHYLESSLYSEGLVEKTVAELVANGKTYERDGALWLKSTEYGDDKDRVMRKSDGSYTYFVPDVAYHVTKFQRGFSRAVTELGSDHHGSLARVRAGLQAMNMGVPAGYPDYVLHQMVTVMRGGEEVKLSKRAGTSVSLRDLIDEVGSDATRYFFVMRKSDSQLTFDIDLARSKSEENPVYYVQYAHARICSVLAQWGGDEATLKEANLALLTSRYESDLMRLLADFPQTLKHAAEELAPHLVTVYLTELASKLHAYYNAERFLIEDQALMQARLALIHVTRQVLKNGLTVMGVSAPEKM